MNATTVFVVLTLLRIVIPFGTIFLVGSLLERRRFAL
jgi:hypothetical protein